MGLKVQRNSRDSKKTFNEVVRHFYLIWQYISAVHIIFSLLKYLKKTYWTENGGPT